MRKTIILFLAVVLSVGAYAADSNVTAGSDSQALTKKELRRTLRGTRWFIESGANAAYNLSLSSKNPYKDTYVGLDMSAAVGMQANNFFFIGVGAGVSRYVHNSASMPLFIDMRINMSNRRVAPVLDIKGGGVVGNINGGYFSVGLGMRIALAKSDAIYIMGDLSAQLENVLAEEDLSNIRFGAKIGYEF